eukprot:1365697-Alexandrium_andersonii.AAC.1
MKRSTLARRARGGPASTGRTSGPRAKSSTKRPGESEIVSGRSTAGAAEGRDAPNPGCSGG